MTAQQHINPVAADLVKAQYEVNQFVYEASRVSCALRSLGDVMGDEENRVDPAVMAGLAEAVSLVGEHLERYANDRAGLLDQIVAERQEVRS